MTSEQPGAERRPTPAPPQTADDLTRMFRGAIRTGQLGDGERLPTVRQTARDFGVAQGTAAKAYRALEHEGLVVTRTAAGTRVAPGASRAPGATVAQARRLMESAQHEGLGLDDTLAVLRAVWAPADDRAAHPAEGSAP